ncbi:hypothetical protein COP2_025512 [Malus domestica]
MRSHRFDMFKANPCRAARHQRLNPLAQHDVTWFSYMTSVEIPEKSTRSQRVKAARRRNRGSDSPDKEFS